MIELCRKKLRDSRKKRGFTLIELMIVVVIIMILASVAIAAFIQWIDEAQKEKARTFIAVVRGKQELYNSRFGRFLTAPANPAAVPSDGNLEAWVTTSEWISLGANPRAENVGWQYQTGGGTGACAAGGGAGMPPADAAPACAGLATGTWYWVTARNDEWILVTNSARPHVWELEQ